MDIEQALPGLGTVNRLAGLINVSLESGQYDAPVVSPDDVDISQFVTNVGNLHQPSDVVRLPQS